MCKLRILSALFALLFCGALSAQDVISTKDGREIEAKVLEVGTEELVYKKWSNPDGPDYHILLSEVLQVRYENGEVETYGAPGTEAGMVRRFRGQVGGYDADLYFYSEYPEGTLYRDGTSLLVKGARVSPGAVLDPDLYDRWRTGESMRLWGMSTWLAGSAVVCTGLSLLGMPGEGAAAALLSGGVLLLVGIPLHLSGNDMLEKVVGEQNARRKPGAAFAPSLDFGVQRHGIGFALNF